MPSHGSLFTGIGGFDLGFETAGFSTLWQVESNSFRRRVLSKHWPDVIRYDDVQGLTGLPKVDVVTGGFPCQDTSQAGDKEGIEGSRSSLWAEMFRIITEVNPKAVVIENVPALRRRGLRQVLADLASVGFDAEWDCLSARAFGSPHKRDRLWVVAYPHGSRGSEGAKLISQEERKEWWRLLGNSREPDSTWPIEPGMDRVAYGLPDRLDRNKSLGDSLVPDIAEFIAWRIKTLIL